MLEKSRSGSQGHTGAEEQLFLSRLVILELKLFQLMTKLKSVTWKQVPEVDR